MLFDSESSAQKAAFSIASNLWVIEFWGESWEEMLFLSHVGHYRWLMLQNTLKAVQNSKSKKYPRSRDRRFLKTQHEHVLQAADIFNVEKVQFMFWLYVVILFIFRGFVPSIVLDQKILAILFNGLMLSAKSGLTSVIQKHSRRHSRQTMLPWLSLHLV